ncbi:hypothetical protein BUALT_Bualt11G0113000 [Buddleja alternifolia]|uniref:Uncharacterized protein n=1 Tax=Buddleja alternifolia TaxID=168488 RepID=A0AAV6WVY4_9LAMI|nr:hypothetical protein BUALT_Bualt11G0113000 [Buddleja alternifolia]
MDEDQKIEIEFKIRGVTNENQFSEDVVDFDNELPGAVDAEKDVSIGLDINNRLPELHESMEPERTQRNRRYNLRKSLAWDSAFFTSAGVLDPEELSCMMTGLDKSEKKLLPGIEEDVTGSTESITTLGSDHLTLETHEDDDLFLDIRASIQRSSKKASNLKNSSSKTGAIEVDSKAISSLKKEDLSSQNKNPKPGFKKTGSLQTVRMSKCQPKQNIAKLGSGKAIKQDSGPSQMKSTSKIGETNSILPKPPKAISKSISTSTTTLKRDSIGTGRIKVECGSSKLGTTVSAKGVQPPKVSALSGVRRALPKPTVSSKSSFSGSSTTSKVQPLRSSTSSDSSSGISSGTPIKSSLMTARRNPVKSGNVGKAPVGSTSKTPSRAALKNKPSPSTLSAHLMSTQISQSVSPASSISEWSSASSSSSSMAYQRSNISRISLDASSCKSIDGGIVHLDMRNHSADQTADGDESKGVNLHGKIPKKSSTQTGSLQATVKPSGLRMPSPKIGFFDGVKSSNRTPNGPAPSGLQTVFPKNGAAINSPARSSNVKLKSTKVPTARTVTSLGGVKADFAKATSSPSLQEKSHASVSDSCISTDVKDSPSLCLEVKGNANGESCQKEEKTQVEDGVKQVVGAGTGAIIKQNSGDLNNEMDLNMKKDISTGDIKIASVEGTQDGVLFNQNHHINNNNSSIYVANDKENSHEGEAITGDIDTNVSGLKYELLSDVSDIALPCPGTIASESTANRAPFAPKNIVCNNECINMSKELATQVAEKTAFALDSSERKENSS